jgi:hypothetical protein
VAAMGSPVFGVGADPPYPISWRDQGRASDFTLGAAGRKCGSPGERPGRHVPGAYSPLRDRAWWLVNMPSPSYLALNSK